MPGRPDCVLNIRSLQQLDLLSVPLTPPFVLVDRYDITAEIGRGGHAVVYHARDRVLDREVAVKLLREDVLSSDTLARFRKEVQVTAQLEHAHILHVYDTGTFEGRPFIVMELASGSTLAARLGREHLLPIVDALQIARDIGLALAHAHARGIVHRDVKPENILLGTGGAILADFGIARVTQEVLTQKITSTGTTVGTVQYMSPEQLCAEPDIDARSDQYSLACVLYEMLTGVRPHMAATFEALRVLRTTGRCEPVRTHRVSVPAAVDDAIARALSPIPADRFRGMDEFLSATGANASGEFTTSDGAGVIARSGGYGAVSGGDGRSPVSVENARGAAATSDPSGVASQLVKGLISRRVIVSALAASVVVAAGVFAAESWKRGEESAGTLADGVVTVALIDADSRSSDTTSVAARIRGALSAELDSWSGLRVVNKLPSNDTSAFAIAPSIGTVGDSVRVRLEIRRAGRATPERVDALVAGDEARRTPAAIVATLVRRALVHRADGALTTAETPGIEAMPERSMTVLRAYVGGFAALRAGKLDSAAASFRVAARSSGKPYAQAEFWAAQSGAWSEPKKPDAWKANIDNAVRARTLHGVDSLLATALGAMSRGEFPEACVAYREATKKEANSFVAWYGLGECQRLDSVVVKGPEGYRFRSSHWAALGAYEELPRSALTSDWLAAVYMPILRTTYAEGSRARHGRMSDLSRSPYSALPTLNSDSIAFFPLARERFQDMGAAAPPAKWVPGVRLGRAVAVRITKRWVDRWPESSAGWLQRSLALELSGIDSEGGAGLSPAAALDRAEAGATSPVIRANIAVARVRIALRRSDFSEVGRAARSAIELLGQADAEVRLKLAPLAALIGATREAEAFSMPDPEKDPTIPAALGDSIAAFRLRANVGLCENLLDNRTRLDSMFSRQFTPAEQPEQRERFLHPAYRDAVPCLGPQVVEEFAPQILLDRVYHLLFRGDSASARRLLTQLRVSRSGATISAITWDVLFAESWALVQAGDTSVARVQLVSAFNGAADMSTFTLSETPQAAGFRRALQLLDRLSPSSGGRAGVSMWTRHLRALVNNSMENKSP